MIISFAHRFILEADTREAALDLFSCLSIVWVFFERRPVAYGAPGPVVSVGEVAFVNLLPGRVAGVLFGFAGIELFN